MYIYIYRYIHTHYIYISINIYKYLSIYMYIYLYIYVCMRVCVWLNKWLNKQVNRKTTASGGDGFSLQREEAPAATSPGRPLTLEKSQGTAAAHFSRAELANWIRTVPHGLLPPPRPGRVAGSQGAFLRQFSFRATVGRALQATTETPQ